jgi:protein-disulfide isomerase
VRAAAVAVAAALSLIPGSTTAAKPAPTRDWSHTIVVTPEGGFRMGNPAAKVKLVEYGSLACPHCRHFEQTGYKPLVQGYVRNGKVSYEFRNFLINGPDIAVSVLTRCAGPAKFFPMSEAVYATQPDWEKKFENISDADKAAIEKMSDKERIVRFAEIGGMPQIAARFGVTPAQAKQCLSDGKKLQQLLDMTKAAMDSGITHTPTFVVDGKVTDVATWEDLEPQLKAALGGNG